MKRFNVTVVVLAVLLTFLVGGCGVETPDNPVLTIVPPTGTQLFANYVAIGNSLTAGYMDAGLHMAGQMDSYPAIIARQMGLDASPGSLQFTQPWIAHPGVGSSDTGDPGLIAGVLYWTGTGIDVIGVTPAAQVPALAIAQAFPIPYNNLGVPGATTLDVSQAVDSGTSQSGSNSFFDLILRNPTFGNVTMLGQCVGRGPTLVTVWAGSNDVLAGATSGEPELGVNIAPPSVFGQMFEALVTGLEDGVEAKTGYVPVIIAANITSVTSIAYFMPQPVFEMVVGAAIPTVEDDVQLVRFPAISYVSGGGDLPLPAAYTIDADELDLLETTVDGFNAQIETICAAHGIPVVDINGLLNEINTTGVEGLNGNHFILQQPFPDPANPETAFSLDGIHPNNMAQGLIANRFIAAINTAAGTSLAPVDIGSLTWDPTYSAFVPPARATESGGGLLSEAAAHAIDAVFR